MKKIIKLSDRLKAIASFLSDGSFFADIGTDHAFLPVYVCFKDKQAKAIAGDIGVGPFEAACKTVDTFEMSHLIDVRLGNGLKVVGNDNISEVVIAGMGGALIANILKEGSSYLSSVTRIIAQPNVGEKSLREWIYENDFLISAEKIIEENGHIYEIIVADRTVNIKTINLNEKELLFGPYLIQEKNELFIEKWNQQLTKNMHVLEQLRNASQKNEEKMFKLKQRINLIKEVLSSE